MPWLLWLLPLLASTPPDMVLIPAGEFVQGSDADEADERPAHRVHLSAFFLDAHEVTVGQYAECVKARQCRSPRGPVGATAEPVVWVSWNDAQAYCHFRGRRLPTEAEWEKAARGSDARRFPWGDTLDCSHANFGNYQGEGRCPGNPGKPMQVEQFPSGRSPYGVHDLAGNVWEWVADYYSATYYRHAPRRDPQGPSSGPRRVLRGGACCSIFGLPRSANRNAFPAGFSDGDIGFRCARDAR